MVRQHALAPGPAKRARGPDRRAAMRWPRTCSCGRVGHQQVLARPRIDATRSGSGSRPPARPSPWIRGSCSACRVRWPAARRSAPRGARRARTSGTEPVTVTPSISPSRRTFGRRIGADDQQLARRTPLPQQRQRVATEVEHALLVRVVVHAPDEGDRVGVVAACRPARSSRCRRRWETSPWRRRCRSSSASPTRRAWWRCTGRSSRARRFSSAASRWPSHAVAQPQRERLVVGVLEPLLRIHVAEVQDLRHVAHAAHVVRDRRAVHEDQVEALARPVRGRWSAAAPGCGSRTWRP